MVTPPDRAVLSGSQLVDSGPLSPGGELVFVGFAIVVVLALGVALLLAVRSES